MSKYAGIQPRGRSIRSMLVVLLFVVLLPVLVLQSVVYYRRFESARKAQLQTNLELARLVAKIFEMRIEDVLSDELAIGRAMVFLSNRPAAEMNAFLEGRQRDPAVESYRWIDPQGRIVASTVPSEVGRDTSSWSYFYQLTRIRRRVVTSVFPGPDNNQPVFAVARGILGEGGALRGIVLAYMSADRLGEVLKIERAGRSSIAVLDATGHLVYRWPEMKLTWEQRLNAPQQPAIQHALLGTEVTTTNFAGLGGEVRWGGFVPVRSIGWVAGASRPASEVMGPILADVGRDALLFVAVSLTAFAAALFASRSLTAPIRQLSEQARALGEDPSARIRLKGPREIEHCAAAFNRMAEQIQTREKRILESEEVLQTVVSQMPGGVFFAEAPDGRIVLANDAAQQLLGRELGLGTCIDEKAEQFGLLRPDGRTYDSQDLPISRALQGGAVTGQEVVIRQPGGDQITVLVNCAPVVAGGKVEKAIAVFQDITPLKDAHRLLEDCIRTISHDLRNPLGVIAGHARILERAAKSADPAVMRSAEAILASAGLMKSIIQDLIDAARIDSRQLRIDPAPSDVRACVLDLKERMAPLRGTERIMVEAPDNLPAALADPFRLQRILTNLLTNALKYSWPESTVRVSLAQRQREIVASIRDQGPGIPPEEVPHLFDRYYRTRAARAGNEGLGLGLYITKGFVEAQGGRIWVESVLNQGSCFHFSLPVA